MRSCEQLDVGGGSVNYLAHRLPGRIFEGIVQQNHAIKNSDGPGEILQSARIPIENLVYRNVMAPQPYSVPNPAYIDFRAIRTYEIEMHYISQHL